MRPRTISAQWTWDEVHQLPQSTYRGDIHAGKTWSKLGTRFGGVSLDLLLGSAEPLDGAAFVLATSSTGYTTNLPLSHVTGGQAWIVWTHDGTPLPREHGGPARLLVPHLYLLEEREVDHPVDPARSRPARLPGTRRLPPAR